MPAANPNLQDELATNLKSMVMHIPGQDTEVFAKALALLDTLQASPSCHRIVTSTLLQSCQSIDGSSPDTEESVETVKSIYATQLALCELASAGSLTPEECKPLVPSSQERQQRPGVFKGWRKTKTNSRFGEGQIQQCLHSLESRPQSWTSYSNAHQNAVVMCKAARVDIERGELKRDRADQMFTNGSPL